MKDMARTIDNLGVDTSTQYAEGREAYDESLIKDSPNIPSQIRVDVTTPILPSEFDALFGLSKRGSLWPNFRPPPRFYTSRRRLFAEQLIPTIGTPEAQEMQIERLEAFNPNKEIESKKPLNPEDTTKIGHEKTTLLHLLKYIHSFDRDLIEINARRVQYQKG